MTVERKNSDSRIELLEKPLVKTYPTQAVIWVMDNAAYHYSAKVQAALSLFGVKVAKLR